MNAPRAPGVTTSAAVRATGLVKRYGELAAVDGLDLEIAPGEFFGLLGPNGSGKTTTLHMLATLIRPSAGAANVAGFDIAASPVQVRASIGLVFQESALDRTLTVAQNLRFAGLLHDLAPRVIEARSRELLELFDLSERRDQPVGALSGGMRRALDIVRGVLHQPRCLLLDEPTIGLDLPNRRRIWRFIERLRARTGMTVLLTTHYLEEAEALCGRIAMLKQGRVVALDTTRNLLTRYAGVRVRIRVLPASLPEALTPLEVGSEGDSHILQLPDYGALERMLTLLREAGIAVQDLEVMQADLEEVFVQMMHKF